MYFYKKRKATEVALPSNLSPLIAVTIAGSGSYFTTEDLVLIKYLRTFLQTLIVLIFFIQLISFSLNSIKFLTLMY